MTPPNDADLGKALRAWQAYNYKEKKDCPAFNLRRWLKVVKALSLKGTMSMIGKVKKNTKYNGATTKPYAKWPEALKEKHRAYGREAYKKRRAASA